MDVSEAAILQVLATCVLAGDSPLEALHRLETVGGPVTLWARRVASARRSAGAAGRASGRTASVDVAEAPTLTTLLTAASVLQEREQMLLAVATSPELEGQVLAVLALRRQRAVTLVRALRGALVGPAVLIGVSVLLESLPNVLVGGAFLAPVLRGLLLLALVLAAVGYGLPRLLLHARHGASVLSIAAVLPWSHRLADAYSESELVALRPFVVGSLVRTEGLLAVGATLSWSALGAGLQAAARATTTSFGSLEAMAPYASPSLNLELLAASVSKELAPRLTHLAERKTEHLARTLASRVRAMGYALAIALSLVSLASMLTQKLSAGSWLPGLPGGNERQELEELLKQLDRKESVP